MGMIEIKLGSTVKLDEEKEKDLIDLVNRATTQHKLGEIIGHLLRIYNENPEELNGNKESLTKLIIEMSDFGLTPNRYKFFNQVTKDVADIKRTVDKIYEMSLKTYTLAQFGKRAGLEGKSNNMLLASFLLERQLTDLCDTLGVNNLNHTFSSNKLEIAQKNADETLEFILESYDNIVEELRKNIFKEVELSVKPLKLDVEPLKVELDGIAVNNVTTKTDNVYPISTNKQIGNVNGNTLEQFNNTEDDEIIDFGEADVGALDDFFGRPD